MDTDIDKPDPRQGILYSSRQNARKVRGTSPGGTPIMYPPIPTPPGLTELYPFPPLLISISPYDDSVAHPTPPVTCCKPNWLENKIFI